MNETKNRWDVKISIDLKRPIRQHAFDTNQPISKVVNTAVKEFLDKLKNEEGEN